MLDLKEPRRVSRTLPRMLVLERRPGIGRGVSLYTCPADRQKTQKTEDVGTGEQELCGWY